MYRDTSCFVCIIMCVFCFHGTLAACQVRGNLISGVNVWYLVLNKYFGDAFECIFEPYHLLSPVYTSSTSVCIQCVVETC